MDVNTQIGSAVALSAFVGVNYYGEKVARTAQAKDHVENLNTAGEQGHVVPLDKTEGAQLRQHAAKLQSRNSGAYYGAMSGEYTVKN